MNDPHARVAIGGFFIDDVRVSTAAKPSRRSVARKEQAAPDLSELVARARRELTEHGHVKLATLGPLKVRPSIAAQLVREGYESTKSTIRRPLATQLQEALDQGTFVPLKTAHTFVAGATSPEAKKVAIDLVRQGKARLVLRTKVEVLVPSSVDVLGPEELRSARDGLSAIVKRLSILVKSKSLTSMLRADFLTSFDEARPNSSGRAAVSGIETLLRTVDRVRDERLGLSFVPLVIRGLAPEMDVETSQALLLEASRRGLLELRPESGLGRLSEQDLRDCPPGPQGTHLSWARRL